MSSIQRNSGANNAPLPERPAATVGFPQPPRAAMEGDSANFSGKKASAAGEAPKPGWLARTFGAAKEFLDRPTSEDRRLIAPLLFGMTAVTGVCAVVGIAAGIAALPVAGPLTLLGSGALCLGSAALGLYYAATSK